MEEKTILEMVRDVIRETSISIIAETKCGHSVAADVTALAALVQAVGHIPGVQ